MTVHLVGAGPGDPDLLTLRAARLLATADVVVHDRLVGPGVLELIPSWVRRIDVGKDPMGRSVPQRTINEILITEARVHDVVVRLKGGDPYVFGRGGEEATALTDAGVEVVVVPGITSALAGAAAAGISVTQRGVSRGVTVLTGTEVVDGSRPVNWDAAAELGTTLVILMGASRAPLLRDRLLRGGMSPDTPVAVVTRATTPEQTITRLVLADLGRRPVENPSILIVGDVAATALASFESSTVPEREIYA